MCQSCKKSYCDNCVIRRKLGKFMAFVCPDEECCGRCVELSEVAETGKRPSLPNGEPDSVKSGFGRFFRKRILFYLALILPAASLIFHDVLLYMKGGSPLWWLHIGWACLIYLMARRRFFALAWMTLFCLLYGVYTGYLLKSGDFGAPARLLQISLLIWGASVIVLVTDYTEFTE